MRAQRSKRSCFNVSGHCNTQAKRLNRKGIALIWTAILIMFIILLVGLSIDAANLYLTAHKLQNAADAGSLAGALAVKTNPNLARSNAYNTASANQANGAPVLLDLNAGNDPNGDIVLGMWFPQTRIFEVVAPGEYANAVKVVAGCGGTSLNAAVDLIFGGLVEIPTASVSRDAIAFSSGSTGAGLLALACGSSCEDTSPSPCGGTPCSGPAKEGDPGLQLVGCSIIDIGCGPMKGEVVVNCESCDHPKPAVSIGGCAIIENAAQMNVVGCYDGPGEEEMGYPILDDDPCNYMPDPLGCWPVYDCLMPQLGADPDNDLSPDPNECKPWEPDPNTLDPNVTDPCFVLWPGYYSGGINITSAPYPVILQPGIYILDGEICSNINATGGLHLTGGTIDASAGVMFYILGGSVDIGGNAELTATELVPWDGNDPNVLPYEGMLIYQDPDNCTPAQIIGSSDFLLVGTIYFPFNEVEIGGAGYAVGSQLIANSIIVHTSGEGVCIAYDGRYRAQGSRSYLVE